MVTVPYIYIYIYIHTHTHTVCTPLVTTCTLKRACIAFTQRIYNAYNSHNKQHELLDLYNGVAVCLLGGLSL